jgi:soluble lytic murein transglycosylase-like protein
VENNGGSIHPGSAKAKRNITLSGSTLKKQQESGDDPGFPRMNWNGNVALWLPPSFEDQSQENEQCEVTPVQIDIIQLKELMPALPYADIVYPVSMKYNVDWKLVAAVIQAESSFNPDAVSPVGARGLMQLMPATAAEYGVTPKALNDPQSNVEAGVQHLKMLSRLYDGDISLIAAAYNAGQGTVAKFDGIPPFEETRNYVERVVSYYNSFAT